MNTRDTTSVQIPTQGGAQILPFELPATPSESSSSHTGSRTPCVWIDPSGRMHIPGFQTHEEWAESYLRKQNTLVNSEQTTAADVLFDKGWRIIRFVESQLTVKGGELSRPQNEELIRFAAALRRTMILDDGNRTTLLYIARIPADFASSPAISHR